MRHRPTLTAIALIAILMISMAIWFSRPFAPAGPQNRGTPLAIEIAPAVATALDEAALGTPIDGVMILRNGKVVAEYGDNTLISNVASIRKSIIAVLYGIAVDRNLIQLDETLASLGIDEGTMPLTAREKTATVRDLLMARSGVYLPSGAETARMKEMRPARGAYPPGAHYYYNNWDFNVLGAIFAQKTGMSIGEALDAWIGAKIGFQDFLPEHVTYAHDGMSGYPTWRIYVSNRDLARLGQLVRNGGLWDGERVVSGDWVARMLTPWSETPFGYRYGYLWWIDDALGINLAIGAGGQFLMLAQDSDLVVAIRNDTGRSPIGMLRYRLFGEEVSTALAEQVWAVARQLP